MGMLMVVGIAVSNGILLVDDANRRYHAGCCKSSKLSSWRRLARDSYRSRMTTLATVIELPTALALEKGTGSQPTAGTRGRRRVDVFDAAVAVLGSGHVSVFRQTNAARSIDPR